MACSTCRNFRRSVAGRLGYCQQDRTRQVLRGDEQRDCWAAPAEVEAPLLGLFGSLGPTPSAAPQPMTPRPPAPTAAVAAQRRWDEIVAGGAQASNGGDGRGGAVATALPATAAATASAATATRGLPAWLESGRTSGRAARSVVVLPASVEEAASVTAAPSEAPALVPAAALTPAPTVHAHTPPVRAWNEEAPAAATPSPAAAPSAIGSVLRWRHAARDEPPAPAATVEEQPIRRAVAFSLLPATLTNRLRRGLDTRGLRVPPGDPGMTAIDVPAPSPAPRPAPFAGARQPATGLREAPIVPGTIQTLGDQLRRAEQIRRERALLDGERLRGDRGGDPGP